MDNSLPIPMRTKKKATPILESTRSSNIIKYLNSHTGCLVRKRFQAGFSHEGDPDITGSLVGRHTEIEVKQPGNKPTLLQYQRLAEWKETGAIVGVVTNVEDVEKLLQAYSINLIRRVS